MIVKLHTTPSTNNYLKEWIATNTPENFMIVVANNQTTGRGQMGTNWLSESGKNLTFSIFIKPNHLAIERQFQLNQAVSLGLLMAIKKHTPNAKIKWPNDILADGKKISGILIENTVSKNKIKHSIVGIGLNVNQIKFPKEIPNASSLKLLCNTEFNLDDLLDEIVNSIKKHIHLMEDHKQDFLEEKYLQNLFLFQKEVSFSDKDQKEFIGKIVGVSSEGRLQVQLTSKDIVDYAFKEIRFK